VVTLARALSGASGACAAPWAPGRLIATSRGCDGSGLHRCYSHICREAITEKTIPKPAATPF
jgi:hypothetical protein